MFYEIVDDQPLEMLGDNNMEGEGKKSLSASHLYTLTLYLLSFLDIIVHLTRRVKIVLRRAKNSFAL